MIRTLFARFRKPALHPAAQDRRDRAELARKAHQRRADKDRARCVGNLPALRLSIARERGGE